MFEKLNLSRIYPIMKKDKLFQYACHIWHPQTNPMRYNTISRSLEKKWYCLAVPLIKRSAKENLKKDIGNFYVKYKRTFSSVYQTLPSVPQNKRLGSVLYFIFTSDLRTENLTKPTSQQQRSLPLTQLHSLNTQPNKYVTKFAK